MTPLYVCARARVCVCLCVHKAPMSDYCRAHLGDFVAISPEEVVIMSKDLNMVGQHGGATPAEMEIPLIVASDLKLPQTPAGTGAGAGGAGGGAAGDLSSRSARL